MKLAALLLGRGRVVVCYGENADAFTLDRYHASAISNYLRQRLGLRGSLGRAFIRAFVHATYSVVGEPLALASVGASVLLWLARGRRRTRKG
jgi:hypothetical protein